MTPDHYTTLGVEPTASAAAIRAAYLALMREYHPDRNPDPAAVERAQAVIAAHKVLGDFDRRNHYDWDRRREREAAAAGSAKPARKVGAGVIAGAIGLAAVGAFVFTPAPEQAPRPIDPPVAEMRPAPIPEPTRVAMAPPKKAKAEPRAALAEPVKPRVEPERPKKVEVATIEPKKVKPVRTAKVEPSAMKLERVAKAQPKAAKPVRVAKIEPAKVKTAKPERVRVKVAARVAVLKAPAPRAIIAPTPPAPVRQAKVVAKPVRTAPAPTTDLASLDQFVMNFYGQSWRYGDAPKRAALERSRNSFVVRRAECGAEQCKRAAYLKLMRDVSLIVETGAPNSR